MLKERCTQKLKDSRNPLKSASPFPPPLLGQEVLEPLLEALHLAMPQIEELLLLRKLRLQGFRLQAAPERALPTLLPLQLKDGANPQVQVHMDLGDGILARTSALLCFSSFPFDCHGRRLSTFDSAKGTVEMHS